MSQKKSDHEAALQEINVLLDQTRPKHIATGITSGIGYILAGAVGACGIAVLSPIIVAKAGAEEGGVIGGVVGGVCGTAVGAVAAANVAGGGLVSGVGQVVRGVAATPLAVTEPRRGKWWNDAEGRWIYTNLEEECHWLRTCPEDDGDILETGDDVTESKSDQGVKDAFYYNVLEVDPSVSTSVIKRKYYLLARRFSPDRTSNNPEAAERFRDIGHAYFILSDEKMRARYDKFGRDFVDYDEEEKSAPLVEPIVLYRVLYGSEKFDPYFGRLAAATADCLGDSPSISLVEARMLQKRRVTRLAILLATRLEDFTKYGDDKIARANWMAEADFLVKASYGYDLLQVVGKVYAISAIQFLGSVESGIGLPSVANWSKKQLETMKHVTHTNTGKAMTMAGDFDKMAVEAAIRGSGLNDGTITDEEHKAREAVVRTQVGDRFLQHMWKTTVVDITSTVHEAAQMVLHDQSVPPATRLKRGLALQLLGEIFMAQAAQEGPNFDREGQQSYEEVAFSAIVETTLRKEVSYQLAKAEIEANTISEDA